MASRYAGTYPVHCPADGCTESSFYSVSTLADRKRIAADQKRSEHGGLYCCMCDDLCECIGDER